MHLFPNLDRIHIFPREVPHKLSWWHTRNRRVHVFMNLIQSHLKASNYLSFSSILHLHVHANSAVFDSPLVSLSFSLSLSLSLSIYLSIYLTLPIRIFRVIIFTQPLRSGRIWHKVNFLKRVLTGLNSEFSLS